MAPVEEVVQLAIVLAGLFVRLLCDSTRHSAHPGLSITAANAPVRNYRNLALQTTNYCDWGVWLRRGK